MLLRTMLSKKTLTFHLKVGIAQATIITPTIAATPFESGVPIHMDTDLLFPASHQLAHYGYVSLYINIFQSNSCYDIHSNKQASGLQILPEDLSDIDAVRVAANAGR